MTPMLTRDQLADALGMTGQGDRAAFRQVYLATSAKLLGVCLRILADRQIAEDVLQETYLTVWKKAGTFDASRASPITWLVTIARNRAIDRLRASANFRRSTPVDDANEVVDGALLPSETVERDDDARRLHQQDRHGGDTGRQQTGRSNRPAPPEGQARIVIGRSRDPGGDARPQARGRFDRRDLPGKGGQMGIPGLDLCGKGRVTGLTPAGLGLGLGRQYAQGQFPGQGVVFIDIGRFGHGSRQALSRRSPRRIQLFIVPSGTFSRVARLS